MSDRLLEDFAQVSCDWFWEMDANLRFSYFSERWKTVFGFSPDREIGKSRMDIAINAADQVLWAPHVADLLARRSFRDLTYPYRHQNGKTLWLRVSGQPMFDVAGEFSGYRGVGTDVTAQHEADALLTDALLQVQRANSALIEQNLLFDTALNIMSHGLCMWDDQLRIIVCNGQFLKIYGFSPEVVKPGVSLWEVMAHSIEIGNHPDASVEQLYNDYMTELRKHGSLTMERELLDGRVIAISHRSMSKGGWVATYEEITERKTHLKRLQERETELRIQNERFEAALNNMGSGLAMFDPEFKLIVSNRRYAEMYGISPTELKPGISLRSILEKRVAAGCFSGDDPDAFVQNGLASAGSKEHDAVELRDGRIFSIARNRLSESGWVTTHSDVTEQKRAEALVRHMAHHDSLTGLPNRLMFREHMNHSLQHAGLSVLAILLLDLDGFKAVNDTFGHPVGDALLQSVTKRLRDCVGKSGMVSRLGGDEFAILLTIKSDSSEASLLADAILKSIAAPYEIDGHGIVIGTSIGIALFPRDGTKPAVLLKQADLALYRSKSDGRGLYRYFSRTFEKDRIEKRSLEGDLRQALALKQFEVVYQPAVNLESGLITSCEALVRWHHPSRGLLMPADFISMAEDTGLIAPIGAWVLNCSCQEASTWPADIKVAVNISPVQFKHQNLVQVVIEALAASGLPAKRLELEITESVDLSSDEGAFEALQRLRDFGVRICLDDFGVGYSSLGYLRRFKFDKIKIDRSFIKDISEKHSDARLIVNAIASLGRTLGVATTAEGVETVAQLANVREQGCTEVQGYYFYKPKTADQIAELLSKTPQGIAGAA